MGTNADAHQRDLAARTAQLTKLTAAHEQSLVELSRQADRIAQLLTANEGLGKAVARLTQTVATLTEQLAAARGLAANAPTTPSAQVPTYLKPAVKPKAKRPGREVGHVGVCRPPPGEPDRTVTHELKTCPHCEHELRPMRGGRGQPLVRIRYVEDVIPGRPEVTEHRIHRYWCSTCQKRVEPAVTAALPAGRLGLRVIVQSLWQHYGLGIPTTKIVKMLLKQHGFRVTSSGLLQAWRVVADYLQADYEEIIEVIRRAGVLHADESGWRVNGASHWLWCFCTQTEAVYVIDESRGGAVAREIIGECFDGTLVVDFYAGYNACTVGGTQYCIAHLLREFKKVAAKTTTALTEDFKRFRRRVCAVFGDAIKWKREKSRDAPEREAARDRFEFRLLRVMEEPHEDKDVIRLVKRLYRSAEGLFRFVTEPEVPPTNNWAELNIRPAVVMRKNSYGNRSSAGANTQSILMSLARTCELRGEDVIESLIQRVEYRIIERHRHRNDPAVSTG